ncbi:MAG: branched-chain amino acid ABC transporter permease [Thermomicrobiales bacterium]
MSSATATREDAVARTNARPMLQFISTPVILIGGMLLIALFSMARGDVVFDRVVTVMFINLLLTVGLQVFMGNSGLGSFGQYAFVTIGAYGSIWFSLTPQQKALALPDMPKDWWLYSQHTPFLVAVLIAAVIAAAFGGLIGIALVRLRGASFTIATFALLIVVNRVALQWSELTRGARTVLGIPKLTDLPMAFVWAAVIVVVAYLFKESTVGLKLRASREDEAAAASIGVNAALNRWIAWVLCAAISAIGGALWAHFIQQFSPHNFYLRETFLIVAMLIIGGAGSVSGAVIGAVIVALGQEQLRQLENVINGSGVVPFDVRGFADIVLAVAIILVLIRWPSGITRGREITFDSFRRLSGRTKQQVTNADARSR